MCDCVKRLEIGDKVRFTHGINIDGYAPIDSGEGEVIGYRSIGAAIPSFYVRMKDLTIVRVNTENAVVMI